MKTYSSEAIVITNNTIPRITILVTDCPTFSSISIYCCFFRLLISIAVVFIYVRSGSCTVLFIKAYTHPAIIMQIIDSLNITPVRPVNRSPTNIAEVPMISMLPLNRSNILGISMFVDILITLDAHTIPPKIKTAVFSVKRLSSLPLRRSSQLFPKITSEHMDKLNSNARYFIADEISTFPA